MILEEKEKIEQEQKVIDLWKTPSKAHQEYNENKRKLLDKIPKPIFQEQESLEKRIQGFIDISVEYQKKNSQFSENLYFVSRYKQSILDKEENTDDLLAKIKEDFKFDLYSTCQADNAYDPSKVIFNDQEYYEKVVSRSFSNQNRIPVSQMNIQQQPSYKVLDPEKVKLQELKQQQINLQNSIAQNNLQQQQQTNVIPVNTSYQANYNQNQNSTQTQNQGQSTSSTQRKQNNKFQ